MLCFHCPTGELEAALWCWEALPCPVPVVALVRVGPALLTPWNGCVCAHVHSCPVFAVQEGAELWLAQLVARAEGV